MTEIHGNIISITAALLGSASGAIRSACKETPTPYKMLAQPGGLGAHWATPFAAQYQHKIVQEEGQLQGRHLHKVVVSHQMIRSPAQLALGGLTGKGQTGNVLTRRVTIRHSLRIITRPG